MKKITTSIAILLLLAGTFFSCNNEKEDYFDEPIDVPFTVFSMTYGDNSFWLRTSCRWVSLTSQPDEIVIINSDKELRNFHVCIEESDFPTIDFSKYTLLLVRSMQHATVRILDQNLQQLSYRNYVINIWVSQSGIATAIPWHIAIITDKLNSDARIRLNVIPYPF